MGIVAQSSIDTVGAPDLEIASVERCVSVTRDYTTPLSRKARVTRLNSNNYTPTTPTHGVRCRVSNHSPTDQWFNGSERVFHHLHK